MQYPPELIAAYLEAYARSDQESLRAIRDSQRAIAAEVRKSDPKLLHGKRLETLYVNRLAGGWSRPWEFSRSDAQNLAITVACEIMDVLRLPFEDDSFNQALARTGQRLCAETEFDENVLRPIMSSDA